jgi:tyrosyl-tRNA synthetase
MTHEDRLEKAREILTRRAQHILPDKEGVARRLASETPQTFYLGIDPTGPDIHIGHTVPLLFLEEIASLGHSIILLVGDFTARIGDPTGKDSTRVILTPEDVGENMMKYESQLRAILPTTSSHSLHSSYRHDARKCSWTHISCDGSADDCARYVPRAFEARKANRD